MIPLDATINWQGWTATLASLEANGWVIKPHPKYNNRRHPKDSMASNAYLLLHHEAANMVAKIRVNDSTTNEYDLIYLLAEKQHKRLFPKELWNPTEEDVPYLLSLIRGIQSGYTIRKNKPNKAECIDMLSRYIERK